MEVKVKNSSLMKLSGEQQDVFIMLWLVKEDLVVSTAQKVGLAFALAISAVALVMDGGFVIIAIREGVANVAFLFVVLMLILAQSAYPVFKQFKKKIGMPTNADAYLEDERLRMEILKCVEVDGMSILLKGQILDRISKLER